MSGFIFTIYSKFFVFIPIDFVGNKGSIFLKYNKVLHKKIFQKKQYQPRYTFADTASSL